LAARLQRKRQRPGPRVPAQGHRPQQGQQGHHQQLTAIEHSLIHRPRKILNFHPRTKTSQH